MSFHLLADSLKLHVDSGTYGRALDVYRSQKVLDFKLHPSGSADWVIDGQVDGSNREVYDTSVVLELAPDGKALFFSGQCSCPVGQDCKHSVAMAIKVAYKSSSSDSKRARVSAATDSADCLMAIEAQIQALMAAHEVAEKQAQRERSVLLTDHKVNQWMDLFGPATSGAATGTTETSDVGHAADEQLLYTLSVGAVGAQKLLKLSSGFAKKLPNGSWTKPKAARYVDPRRLSAQDTDIIQLIDSTAAKVYSYSGQNGYSEAAVNGAAGVLAVQLACATGRLYALQGGRAVGAALQWGAPQTLAFKWEESKFEERRTSKGVAASVDLKPTLLDDPLWQLRAQLAHPRDGLDWFSNTPPLYLDVHAAAVGPMELPGVPAEHLPLLLKAPPIAQSTFARHEVQLLQRLAGVPLPPMIKAPEVRKGITPKWFLHVEKVAANDMPRLGLLRATLRFDYNDLLVYAAHNQNPSLIELPAVNNEPAVRVLLHRDLDVEQAAHTFLRGLGLAGDSQGQFYLPFQSNAHQQLWLRWVDEGFASFKEAGFAVVADDALRDWILRADELDVQLAGNAGHGSNEGDATSSPSPWFDLSLGMAIDGVRHNILPLLPDLLMHLSANLQGSTDDSAITAQMPEHVYLEQSGGSYLRLPTEPLKPWLQALLELVGDKSTKELAGDSLRVSRLEALRLGASLGAGAQWRGADSLREMVNQLAGRSCLPEVAVPDGLVATLRPYQLQGLSWLQFLRTHALGGVLADDMGLGKTLQTLAHVLIEKNAGRLDLPVLIIAPVSLMGNWRKEAERFTPTLRTLVLHGADRHKAAGSMAGHDVVIAPYSLLQRDRERWQAQAWHIVVLDEAQNIKNANSHAAQVVSELNTRHKLCLSGTPMENHLGELWSLFHFLMPGFLGSQAKFKLLFRTPIEKLGSNERLAQLRQRVTPFMLRRNKSDVATDLPDKQEMISSVELEGKQADLYETIRLTTEKAVRDALTNKGLAKSQIQILDALLKLRQVCCDPRLVPVPAAQKVKQSAKLELLMELLPELLAEGRKVLLFSQFTSMLTLIEEELEKRQLKWVKLTGQSQKRDAIIEQFTSGAVPLFLISLKAGGVGLNLTQADTVIHYDPWWNPAVETQATDRAHRIGQTKQVMVYKLVAQGTIEERILALQERKAALASSLYGDKSGEAARKQPLFTESDLAALLKPLGA